VKFWVVDAGAEGAGKREKVQTIKLKLTPVVQGANGGNQDFLVNEHPEVQRR
jgi:hypothetical protein